MKIGRVAVLGIECGSILALIASGYLLVELKPVAAQTAKTQSSAINVRYTDVRQAAGITFQQDSTQTEEKYYLETMGTGVAWIDYDQDGLMDLFFVQSAATGLSDVRFKSAYVPSR